jgi:hypothetical protein
MSGSPRLASRLAPRPGAAGVTARLLVLSRVARTLSWPALLGGALGCGALVALASLDESPPGRWPGFGALALCAGAAFVLDDAAGAAADATPTSLVRRRMLRVALALPLLCAAWAVSLWFATPDDGTLFGPGARGGLSLQFAAMLALTLAGSAVALRVVPDGHAAWAGVVAPFVLLAVAYWLPERWTLFAAPGDGQWPASQWRWASLLALALLTLAWASRDRAARRLRLPRRGAPQRGVGPDTGGPYRPGAQPGRIDP